MNLFDFFDALTLFGKIAVLAISCVVVVAVYLMFKTMKRPAQLLKEYDITLPDGTVKRIKEEAVSEPEPTVKLEAIDEEDRAFEEEKRKLESFGKKKREKTPFHPDDQKPATGILEKPKITGTYTQYVKGPKKKKPFKKPEKEMKFSGTCAFCGKEIGGPVESKKARLMSYDPERVETAKYMTKELLDLPFVCSWCGRTFCIDHRLPEQHNCKKLKE